MKYIREFDFIPSWNSEGFSHCSYNDLYSIPPFNTIAKMLNDNGWEILEYKYENDEPSPYRTASDIKRMRSLHIVAVTTRRPKIDDPYAFIYKMTKNGLITEYEQRKQLKLDANDLEYNLIFPTHNGKGSITNEEYN